MSEENIINLEYERPKFWKRIFANLLDFIIMAFLLVLFFVPTRSLVTKSKNYKKTDEIINAYKSEVSLFVKNDNDELVDIVTYYNDSTDYYSLTDKKEAYIKSIDEFIGYMRNTVSEECGNNIQNEYDEWRVSDKNKFNGYHYFVRNDSGEIVENTEYLIYDENFVKNIYEPYISNYLIGHFDNDIKDVKDSLKKQGFYLLFLEIPVSLSISIIFTYIIPPFIFKRNRSTIGRLTYKIGLVDKNILAVPTKTLVIKSVIFFFLEGLLSIFTLGIPLIITVTMMIFSKKQQGFADYMVNIQEIDLNSGNIYYSKEEALVSTLNNSKKPVDFKPKF